VGDAKLLMTEQGTQEATLSFSIQLMKKSRRYHQSGWKKRISIFVKIHASLP